MRVLLNFLIPLLNAAAAVSLIYAAQGLAIEAVNGTVPSLESIIFFATISVLYGTIPLSLMTVLPALIITLTLEKNGRTVPALDYAKYGAVTGLAWSLFFAIIAINPLAPSNLADQLNLLLVSIVFGLGGGWAGGYLFGHLRNFFRKINPDPERRDGS